MKLCFDLIFAVSLSVKSCLQRMTSSGDKEACVSGRAQSCCRAERQSGEVCVLTSFSRYERYCRGRLGRLMGLLLKIWTRQSKYLHRLMETACPEQPRCLWHTSLMDASTFTTRCWLYFSLSMSGELDDPCTLGRNSSAMLAMSAAMAVVRYIRTLRAFDSSVKFTCSIWRLCPRSRYLQWCRPLTRLDALPGKVFSVCILLFVLESIPAGISFLEEVLHSVIGLG
jgi:hypothetical protein